MMNTADNGTAGFTLNTTGETFRNAVLEDAIDALSRNRWDVFLYYPQQKFLWLPAQTADRLHLKKTYTDAPASAVPRFIHDPESIRRFCSLFERIDRGETFAHEIFLTSFVFNSYVVSLSEAGKDAEGRVTAAIGKITPIAVENACDRYYSISHSNSTGKAEPDPLQMLIQGIAAQFYAIYHIHLASGTYVCYQERLNGILDLIGQRGQYRPAWETYINTSIDPEDREAVRRFADFDTLPERLRYKDCLTITYRRTEVGWTRGSFTVTARNTDGLPTDVVYTVTDITQEVELQQKATQAEYDANHDSLTGLYNRKAFDNVCENPQNYSTRIGLLLLDIDRFKVINDTYGHEEGDKILQRISAILSTLFRDNDYVIRLGGDEFAVVLQNCNETLWPVLCRKLPLLSLGLRQALPDGRSVTLSGGLCFAKRGFSRSLYRMADKALYHTKSLGRAGCTLVSSDGGVVATWRDSQPLDKTILPGQALIDLSLQTMLANTDAYVFIKDGNFVYTAASEAFAREVTGLSGVSAVVGKTDFDIIPDRTLAQKYREDDERLFSTGETKHAIRERIPTRDGRERWSRTTKYLLKDRNGTPAGIFGIAYDITEAVEQENGRLNNTDSLVSATLSDLFYASYCLDLKDNKLLVIREPDSARTLLGDITELNDAIRRFMSVFVHADSRREVAAFLDMPTMAERLKHVHHLDCEYMSLVLDTWFRMSLIPLQRDDEGTVTQAMLVFTRLDEHNIRHIEENLSYKRNLQSLFENVPGGVILYRWDGRDLTPLYISRYYARLYGESLTADNGRPDFKRVHPDDLEEYVSVVRDALLHADHLEHIFRAWNSELGRYISVKINAVAQDQPDGTRLVYAMYSDVTEQTDNEARLIRASQHDPLTGLWHRAKIFGECRRLLKEHPDEEFAMLHFDIRQFRLYNTFYGEKAGDKLLLEIADMFRGMDKDYEYWAYGRVEADVFCVFFPIRRNKYQKHLQDLLTGLDNYRDDCVIEPVIGIYTVTDPGMPIESMFARATIAAKKVKSGTGSRIVFFDESMEREIESAQIVTNEILPALEKEEFKVWLQPKYALDSRKIIGAEALVRWQHPERGLITPGKFIPVLERNGYITKLDRYMWEHTCALLQKWKNTGRPVIPVSVNVSRISMYSQMTVPFLKELVQKYDIEPKYLQLELTETAFMDDPVEMHRQLSELREAGFTILIDDFGTGYSSLNTLRELPADILKLDIGFLPKKRDDARGCAIVDSVISMSQKLGLTVIAEGVEVPEQADYLTEYGCPQVQGYLFARPMPAEDFEALVDGH